MQTSCEFRFGFWDVTARGDASFAVSQNQDFARVTDINLENPIAFPDAVTLEPGFGWPLNGSKAWLPDNAGSYTWGWWSKELSKEDNTFANPPTLTVTFSKNGVPTPHSSAGVTFSFFATLPGTINIKWYGQSGNLIADQDFTPDSFDYFCDWQVENYYKLVITVLSMKYPKRFLRVTRILFGALMVIEDTRVVKATLTEEISPVAITTPINTLELNFFTPGGRFALLDPQGAYKLFQWKQEVEAYKTMDGARSFMGSYYLQEAEGTVDAITKLRCVDVIGILDATEYKGGIYNAVALKTLLGDILTPEGIAFEVDAVFSSVTLTGYLPIGSKRQAIQQIAFAIGAVVDPTRGKSLRFYPEPQMVTASIPPSRKILGHKITLEELVTQVDVTAHQYILGTELRELSKTMLGVGQQTITFHSPVSVTSITGGTLVTNHPNYCVVNVTTAGEVKLSGYEYKDATSVYTVKASSLPAGAKSGVKSVDSATLVDPSKAPAVAQRLYDYYQNRYTDEGQTLPGNERAAERATLSTLGGKTIAGNIQRVVTDLSGGCLETITLRGN